MRADMERIPIAGLCRRFVAGALDGLPVVALLLLLERGRPVRSRRNLAFLGLDGLYTFGYMVTGGRTPGQKAMGIRVVDHASGRSPAWRQVAIRWLALSVPRYLPRLIRKPPSEAYSKALEELGTEIERLRRDRPEDGHRLSEEMMEVYQRLNIKPSKGLAFVALTLLVEGVLGVQTLRDPFRRGLHDRLARTIVVKANPTVGP